MKVWLEKMGKHNLDVIFLVLAIIILLFGVNLLPGGITGLGFSVQPVEELVIVNETLEMNVSATSIDLLEEPATNALIIEETAPVLEETESSFEAEAFVVLANGSAPIFNTNETLPQPGNQYNQTQSVPLQVSLDMNALVWANITYPNNTSTNVNLIFSGLQWYFASSFSNTLVPGVYGVVFNATNNVSNSSLSYTNFTVNDATAPGVRILKPVFGSNYSQNTTINISVNVTDAYYNNVASVVANITWNGTYKETPLIYNATSSLYEGVFTNTSLLGQYNLTIIAKDNANNTNSTQTTRFFVVDTIPPVFLQASPQNGVYNQSDPVKLLVSLNENSTVWANITYPDSTSTATNLQYNGTQWYYNNTFTNTYKVGLHNITFNATDVYNNFNTAKGNFTVLAVDIIAPNVTALSPNSNIIDGDGLVNFSCSAADNTGLLNISLYFNGIPNQTLNINGTSYLANFNSNLADGIYVWYCEAYDIYRNRNTSQSRTLEVNRTAVPISTEYSGNTTNWAWLPDLSNVCNGTAIIDKPVYGQVKWFGCVNAKSQNFDLNTEISNNSVEVNFGLNPSFNSSAEIIIRNLTWVYSPLIYKNGAWCNDACSNVSYAGGVATFNVTHFTNYATLGNSVLKIWDQTDLPNFTAFPNQQINFFANYTERLSGQIISGANCTINFTDFGAAMVYNATSLLYVYNRSFPFPSTKPYNVTCAKSGFETMTLNDSVKVFDGSRVSMLGVSLNISDFSFASDTYVEEVKFNFNTSAPNNTLILLASMNVEKESLGTESDVYVRVRVDGRNVSEEKLLKVEVVKDASSTGMFATDFNVSTGEHYLSMDFMRTGSGSIAVNDIDLSLIQLVTNTNNKVRGSLVDGVYNHSATTYERTFNWTINKTIFSPTFIIAKQTVEKLVGPGSSDVSYYFENLGNGQTSPYWTRYLKDISDSGSASGIFVETEELATRLESINSKTTSGLINVKLKSFNFDLRDLAGNLVSNFHASNPLTNITNSVIYGPGGTHLVLNKTVTIQNGSSYLIGMSTSFRTNTGAQVPTYFINVTGANCYSKKERAIQSGSDIGNAFIYFICEGLEVGKNYTINLWLQLTSNNEIIQLEESLNGFEIYGFSITEGELAPVPNEITSPLNGSYQGGYKNVTWLQFYDQNEDPVVYTVTLRYPNSTLITTLAVNTSSLYTPIDYSLYPSGQYLMMVTGCDDTGRCANSTSLFFIDKDPPVFNTSKITPQIGTNYNQSNVVPLLVSLDENATAWANLTYPDGTSVLTNLFYNGTQWYYNNTFTDTLLPGQYNITFYASDAVGNIGSALTYFIVNDVTAPSVTVIIPMPGTDYYQNDAVAISANVTDAYYNNIASVVANVTWDATYEEVVLNYNLTTGLYEGTFVNSSFIGQYNITIIAADNAGNINNTETSSFNILDDNPPIFLGIFPSGETYNQTNQVPLSVSLDENSTIFVNITYPDGTSVLVNLEFNGTQWNYNTTFTDTLIPGKYNITFNATDIYGNSNISMSYFIVEDITAPSVHIVTPFIGSNYLQNSVVNISANVTDAYYNNMASVIANITWYSNQEEVILNYNPVTGLYKGSFSSTLLLGRYDITLIATDNAGNINNSEKTWFNVKVTGLYDPTIISTTIDPYDPTVGYNVFLDLYATDDKAIAGEFANITLPNGTTITVSLPDYYNVTLAGRHNVTFFAVDLDGNIGTFEDYFIAGDYLVNVLFNTVDYQFLGIPVSLTIYFAGTDKNIKLLEFNGTKLDDHTNIWYDLFYQALSGQILVRLNNINLALDNNDTLGLDRIIGFNGFLVVYGFYDTYNFTDAEVSVSYAGTGYTNEDNLGFYSCSDWNFTARTCNGDWILYSGTQDKTNDLFTFTTSGFSAFAVKQEVQPVQPSAGGGGGSGGGGTIKSTPEKEEESRVTCGNSICESGENAYTCCKDCGCIEGYVCENGFTCNRVLEMEPELPEKEMPKPAVIYFMNPDVLDEELSETILNYEWLQLLYEPREILGPHEILLKKMIESAVVFSRPGYIKEMCFVNYKILLPNLVVLLILLWSLVIAVKRIRQERRKSLLKDVRTLKKEGFGVRKLEDSFIELNSKGERKKTKRKLPLIQQKDL